MCIMARLRDANGIADHSRDVDVELSTGRGSHRECHFGGAPQDLDYEIEPSLRIIRRFGSVHRQSDDEGRSFPRGAFRCDSALVAHCHISADGPMPMPTPG